MTDCSEESASTFLVQWAREAERSPIPLKFTTACSIRTTSIWCSFYTNNEYKMRADYIIAVVLMLVVLLTPKRRVSFIEFRDEKKDN